MTDLAVRPDAEPVTAGWHDDPMGEHQLRYHDGEGWTEHVTHFGPRPCAGCGSHAH